MRSLRSPSLYWTFAGAFLSVLVVSALLQAALIWMVVRPLAHEWTRSEARTLARAAAESIGKALDADSTIDAAPLLREVTQGRGPVALLYRQPGRSPRMDRAYGRFREGRRHTPAGDVLAVEPLSSGRGEIVALGLPRVSPHWPPGVPRPGIVYLPIAAALSGIAGLLLFRSFARRLEVLTAHAARVAAGELDARVPDPGPDEIGKLGHSLNSMTAALAEARLRLEGIEAQRRRFLADVTHELATPLTSIRGYAETLRNPAIAATDAERATYLAHIQVEAERMDALVRDLLDLARLEEMAAPLEIEELDWAELCRNSLERLRPLLDEAGLKARWAGGDAVPIRADGRRLEQVIENLIANAARYVPRGGSVTASVAALDPTRPGWVRLSVEDDGPGFPEAALPHLFERFYRVDPARSTGGTGLGLAIVREIARRHGGEARARNRPGGGAGIDIDLPRVQA